MMMRTAAICVLSLLTISCAPDTLGVSLGEVPDDPAYSDLRRRADVVIRPGQGTPSGACTTTGCAPDAFTSEFLVPYCLSSITSTSIFARRPSMRV